MAISGALLALSEPVESKLERSEHIIFEYISHESMAVFLCVNLKSKVLWGPRTSDQQVGCRWGWSLKI